MAGLRHKSGLDGLYRHPRQPHHTAACVFIPEALVEGSLYERSKLSVAVIVIAKLSLKHIHGAQCVVPKCIYLDRFVRDEA